MADTLGGIFAVPRTSHFLLLIHSFVHTVLLPGISILIFQNLFKYFGFRMEIDICPFMWLTDTLSLLRGHPLDINWMKHTHIHKKFRYLYFISIRLLRKRSQNIYLQD